MTFKDFSDWLCSENGVPYDVFDGLTFFLLLIPYICLLYRFYKNRKIRTPDDKFWYLILIGPISFYLYFGLLCWICISVGSSDSLLGFIGMVSFPPILTFGFYLGALSIGILLLLFSKIIKSIFRP